jgi:hypothetical protein
MAAKAYIRSGEWSEVGISATRKGWLISVRSQIQGTTTRSRVFIPFGGDFPRGCDLDANWNDFGSYGEALIDRAKSVLSDPEAKSYYHARILSRGYEVQ